MEYENDEPDVISALLSKYWPKDDENDVSSFELSDDRNVDSSQFVTDPVGSLTVGSHLTIVCSLCEGPIEARLHEREPSYITGKLSRYYFNVIDKPCDCPLVILIPY